VSSSSFLDAGEGVDTGRVADAGEGVVEVLKAGGKPFLLVVAEHELQAAGEVMQVLAGVVEVDDVHGGGYLEPLGPAAL
jgi:hypothetical protein